MNLRFDGIEFSSLGLSIREFTGREMAQYQTDTVLLSNKRKADVSPGFSDPGSLTLQGMLSADTEDWAEMTHANWVDRLDAVKAAIQPRKGFRKLEISGDDAFDRFRYSRYSSMSLTETGPRIFERPFHPISMSFENLEPFWRQKTDDFVVRESGVIVPNEGSEDVRPKLVIVASAGIGAASGAKQDQVTLLQIDDFQVNWKGIAGVSELVAGDKLIVDAESLTVRRVKNGVTLEEDAIRYYDFAGPGAYLQEGFPRIKKGGSNISYIHPKVASATFKYDTYFS